MTSAVRTAEITGSLPTAGADEPLAVLKGLVSLRRLVGLYPQGHPLVTERVAAVERDVHRHLRASPNAQLQFDVIHSDVHVNGVSVRLDMSAHGHVVRDLTEI